MSGLLDMPKLHLTSWYKDGIPNYIWLCTIFGPHTRIDAFNACSLLFNNLSTVKREPAFRLSQLELCEGHTDILDLVADIFGSFPELKLNLASLSVIPSLPGRDKWIEKFGQSPENSENIIEKAVGYACDQGGRVATDIAFVRLCSLIAQDKLHLGVDLGFDLRDAILRFPLDPEPRLESLSRSLRNADPDLDGNKREKSASWRDEFYSWGFKSTRCIGFAPSDERSSEVTETHEAIRDEIVKIRTTCHKMLVLDHATTGADSRRETVAGIGLYCCDVAVSSVYLGLVSMQSSLSIYRILAECVILANYIASCPADEVEKFREYGAGRAQLLLRKIHEYGRGAAAIDWDAMSAVANENMDEMFVDMPVSSFFKNGLRAISESYKCKDVYDAYYDVGSTYIHAEWCAIATTSLQCCLNPLHLGHYVPRQPDAGDKSEEDVLWLLKRISKVLDGWSGQRN